MSATDTRIQLPFTKVADDGTEVETWHDDQILHEWPTKSMLYKGDRSVATPVELTPANAPKLLAKLPGHPRNTVLEWVEEGGIVTVYWDDRSLRLWGYLPAVEARPDGSNAPGALFHTMEEMATGTLPSDGYKRQPIGWTAYWGWNWENSALAYDAESPARLNLRLSSAGGFSVSRDRISYENLTLKSFRQQNQNVSPKAYEAKRENRLAKAHELETKVSGYDVNGPVPTAIRNAADGIIQHLSVSLQNDYDMLAKKAAEQAQRLRDGNTRMAQRQADSSYLTVDAVHVEGTLMAIQSLKELSDRDGEVHNEKLHTVVGNLQDLKDTFAAWSTRLVQQDPSDDGRWGCSKEERAMWGALTKAISQIDSAVERAS